MATMATTANTRKAALMLTLLALLLPSILGGRTRPPSSPHHSQGHKRSPPAASPPPPPPPPPPAAPAADTAGLVRATCNSTTYYDLCVSMLSADPSSATADVRGLSSIAVTAAAVNASGGAATAVALATGGNSNTTNAVVNGTVQALLRTCATKYDQARDALSAARGSIAQENYDYAAVHVSAAGEYPQVCRVLFQRQRPGEYPPELAAREEALRRLCTVALDIITLLSNNTN